MVGTIRKHNLERLQRAITPFFFFRMRMSVPGCYCMRVPPTSRSQGEWHSRYIYRTSKQPLPMLNNTSGVHYYNLLMNCF